MAARGQQLEGLIADGTLPRIPTKPESVIKVDFVEQAGRTTYVLLNTRGPGTRSAIHSHDSGGVTCILKGQLTLFVEGKAPITRSAGDCYYMPSGLRMIAFNSGRESAVYYDYFNFKAGTNLLTVREGGGCSSKDLQQFCPGNYLLRTEPDSHIGH